MRWSADIPSRVRHAVRAAAAAAALEHLVVSAAQVAETAVEAEEEGVAREDSGAAAEVAEEGTEGVERLPEAEAKAKAVVVVSAAARAPSRVEAAAAGVEATEDLPRLCTGSPQYFHPRIQGMMCTSSPGTWRIPR